MNQPRTCRVCGCTTSNCNGCVERTGQPCHWVGPDLCSACVTPVFTQLPADAEAMAMTPGGMVPVPPMPIVSKPVPLSPIQAIVAERQRQQREEGYTLEVDATGENPVKLALCAASYALSAGGRAAGGQSYWPYPNSFKPKDAYRDLVRAGALVVAALEAMQRQADTQAGAGHAAD